MSTTIHLSPRKTGKTTHAIGLSLLQKDSLYVTLSPYLKPYGYPVQIKHLIKDGIHNRTNSRYVTYKQLINSNNFRGCKEYKHLIFDEYYFLDEKYRKEVYKTCKFHPVFSKCDISIFSSIPFEINPIALELIRELKKTESNWNLIRDLLNSNYTWLIDDFLTDTETKVIKSFWENVNEKR